MREEFAPFKADEHATEWIAETSPFTVARRVKWGECDPAGVVYTVNFSEYVISFANLFYAYVLGFFPEHAKDEHGFGTPIKALSIVFHRSLRPDQVFRTSVTVKDIRTRSFDLEMKAWIGLDEPVFDAVLSPICVSRPGRRSIQIPDVLDKALRGYRARSGS